MPEIMNSLSMPRRVFRKAQQLGAHNDCLVSDGRVCAECHPKVMVAFDFFYQDTPSDQLIWHIFTDFKNDIEEDQNAQE